MGTVEGIGQVVATIPSMPERPGGKLASRPLHFVWIADCSGSMAFDGKIQALNNAIREAVPHMRTAAEQNPHAELLVRAMRFGTGAQWHIAEPTPINSFAWTNLSAGGLTDLGAAMRLVTESLRVPPMTDRALPPVLVLISDGHPTDDHDQAVDELLALPWGQRALRLAIAIGRDADHDVLERFVADPSVGVVSAASPEELVQLIGWASTIVKSVSSPNAEPNGKATSRIPIPAPPLSGPGASSDATW